MGLCPLLPFVGLRKPLMIVWSTPGAAVLAVAGAGGRYDMQHAVGGFIVWGALIGLMGVTGWFERVMKRNPTEIASGLLAGVLARCAMEAFVAAHTALLLVLGVLATYLLAKRLFARYAVVATLWAGIAYVIGTGQMQWSVVSLGFTEPVFTMPAFRWDAVVSLALPLSLATMALQNLPGVAAIGESGVQRPVSKLITLTGVATLILAAFGALAFNLNAVTAAICMAPQAHPNSQRRYIAAASCGALHVAMGIGGHWLPECLPPFLASLLSPSPDSRRPEPSAPAWRAQSVRKRIVILRFLCFLSRSAVSSCSAWAQRSKA